MRTRHLFAALLATLSAATLQAADLPRVLIYQQQVPPKDQVDLNLQVADMLAQELDAHGLLQTVVWSISDPIFRDAALAGTVRPVPENPTDKEVLAAADQLHAPYVIVVKSTIDLKGGKGTLRLFKSRRQIWKDDKSMVASMGGKTSEFDTARSMARTWVTIMSVGPLKGLPSHPKIDDPTIAPGQEPPKVEAPSQATPAQVAPTTPAVGPTVVDNAQLRRDVSSLLAGGRRSEAILRLRDAVDLAPLDIQRRLMLIDALIEQDPSSAASEARRVASLMPDHPEIRVLAARAWLRAGSTTEARQDLNEAIARDPNGAATRLMLAELSLREAKPQEALDDLAPVIAAGPNAEARFLRALSRAVLGGAEGAQQDLAEYTKLQPEPSTDEIARHYALGVAVIESSIQKAFGDEKEFLRKAAVRPKDQEVADEGDRLMRQAQASAKFLGGLVPPLGHRTSHERRLLGLRLLVQSLSDGQRYLTGPDDDTMTDARLNLGEAIKHVTAAHDAYVRESQG